MPSNPDWVCSDPRCGNVNLFKKERCGRCDKRRKGAHVSGGSRDVKETERNKGLFSPDDWSCRNCGNVNWARRSTCNICNTPKVNTLGERTGYGGGFMERDEVVEYRDNASDDEFDEFGRIKKPFRKSVADNRGGASAVQENDRATVSSVGKEAEEDEDEEESGDDADLSKYDIWGENDEADSQPNSTEKGGGAKSAGDEESSSSSTSGSDLASSSSPSSSSSSSPARSKSPRRHRRSHDSSVSKSRSPDSRENGKPADSPRRSSGSNRKRREERDRSREKAVCGISTFGLFTSVANTIHAEHVRGYMYGAIGSVDQNVTYKIRTT